MEAAMPRQENLREVLPEPNRGGHRSPSIAAWGRRILQGAFCCLPPR